MDVQCNEWLLRGVEMEQGKEFELMFNAIDEDAKRYVLAVLRGEFDRACRSDRPRLRLVPHVAPDLTNNQINPLPIGRAG